MSDDRKPIVLKPDTTKTDELRPYVRRVLEALGHPSAMVTDRSLVEDFFAYDKFLLLEDGHTEDEVDDRMADRVAFLVFDLGVPVASSDRVTDVAARLKKLDTDRGDNS